MKKIINDVVLIVKLHCVSNNALKKLICRDKNQHKKRKESNVRFLLIFTKALD